MNQFKVAEPPTETGNPEVDIKALLAWCHSLYESLWSIYFLESRREEENG